MYITLATSGLQFTGNTLDKQALGGSETAFIELAKNFAKLGHKVTCFCQCTEEGEFYGVKYRDISKFSEFIMGGYADLFIVSRFFEFFSHGKLNTKVNVLWNHDILTDEAKDRLYSFAYNVDYMYCLSDYHKWQYTQTLEDLEPWIKLTSNGIDPTLCLREEKKHKIMFTSRPERGLYKALELFERLQDKDLEFLICNYKSIETPETKKIEDLCYDKIDRLVTDGYNIKLDRFTKPELYKNISESKAVIYPTQFPEIFCISAVEAQANGTVFITTEDFAMMETVGYKGVPMGDNYDNEFFAVMKGIIYDDDNRKQFEEEGLKHAKQYTWENVAKQFISDAELEMSSRFIEDKERAYKRMMFESDYVQLRKYLLENDKKNKLLEQLNHDLRFVDGKESLKDIYEEEETHEVIDLDLEQAKINGRFRWFGNQLEQIKDVKTVLDFACHTGSNMLVNAMRYPNIKFVGYDISEKAIKVAKQRAKANNITNVKFTTNKDGLKKYDVVFCGEYLEHTLNPEKEIQYLEFLADKKVFFTVPKGAWESLSKDRAKRLDVVYHVQSFDHRDIDDMVGSKPDYKMTVLNIPSMKDEYGYSLGNYLVSFKPDYKIIPERDYKRKVETIRPAQVISACIIAKNAQNSIERMIDSIQDHVDEIVIANDSSTDDTAIRAENMGAKVYDLPKTICEPDYAGFAYGRNYSVSKANGNWVFWIDTDEVAYDLEGVKKYLECPHFNGFVIKQHHSQLDNFINPDNPQRLYRKDAGKFFGYIHEQVQDKDDWNKPLRPALVMNTRIVNYGGAKEQDRRVKAVDRNLPLLEKDFTENVDGKDNYRKITPILIARDWLNRAFWQYDKYRSFKTRECTENIIPKILYLKKNYYDNEEDSLFLGIWDDLLQRVYEVFELGHDVDLIIDGKELKGRFLSWEDFEKAVKEL